MSQTKGYTYEYPRPAMTADCVIFGYDNGLKVLLIERGVEPFRGMWALPGGFMKMDESIEQCARRELQEETGVSDLYMEQFKVFSSPGRDPRGRVVTTAFIALVRPSDYRVVGGDDAAFALWFDADRLPPLAFDHATIIREARERLKEILKLKPIAFRLVDRTFTVDEIRKVYEAINHTNYDRRNFQRKLMQTGIVVPVADSPADYYADPSRSASMACEPEPTIRRSPGNFRNRPTAIAESPKEAPMELRESPFPASPEDKESRRGKGRGKLFSFISRIEKKDSDNDDSAEGSIKDLFNF